MRRFIPWFLASGIAAILALSILFTALLATPNGARIRSPESSRTLGRSFTVAGDAWMREGLTDVTVVASRPDAEALSFAAARDVVRDRGRPLFALSTWQTRVTLPADGPWQLNAVGTGARGGRVQSATRAITVSSGAAAPEFRSWSSEHLVPVALIIIVAVLLGLLSRSRPFRGTGDGLSDRYLRLLVVLSALMWLNELVYQSYWFSVGGWAAPSAFMVQMCGLSILLLPVAGMAEKERTRQILFDVLYFWGFGGAAQALIAPDLGTIGFPAYRYFSFFLSHGLIVSITAVIAAGGGMRITLRSLLRCFAASNIVLVPVFGFDRLLALIPPYDPGNYFVLGYPPPTGSIVDTFAAIFGPAPRYLIGLEIMALVIFVVLWLPWPVARAISRQGARKTAALR